MKNKLTKLFFKFDKYLTNEFAIMLCLLLMFIILGKAAIAILTLYLG